MNCDSLSTILEPESIDGDNERHTIDTSHHGCLNKNPTSSVPLTNAPTLDLRDSSHRHTHIFSTCLQECPSNWPMEKTRFSAPQAAGNSQFKKGNSQTLVHATHDITRVLVFVPLPVNKFSCDSLSLACFKPAFRIVLFIRPIHFLGFS